MERATIKDLRDYKIKAQQRTDGKWTVSVFWPWDSKEDLEHYEKISWDYKNYYLFNSGDYKSFTHKKLSKALQSLTKAINAFVTHETLVCIEQEYRDSNEVKV